MIPRYDFPSTSKFWTEEHKFKTFYEVELALLESLEDFKIVPAGTAEKVRFSYGVDVERIKEIELETRHDVVAFCQQVTETMPKELSRWFHYGVTSSDIIDTALTLQITRSVSDVLKQFEDLLSSLRNLVKRSEDVLTMGRTHGQLAEPMLLAQKWQGHLEEFQRRYDELVEFTSRDLRMKCSGAVGNYTVITPEIERHVAEKLRLIPENHSTQIVPRDRIAKLVSIGAMYASAMERFCVEIRGLSRSEVHEVSEGFGNKQKGSSTMPHKSNPISCENLTGVARIMRSHLSIALEDCVTWHERDISHSSCERVFLLDHLTLWSYSLNRLSKTIDGLVIHKDVMRKRVEESNTKFTSLWLHELILKTNASREEIYDRIQAVTRTGNVKSWDVRDHLRSIYGVILSHPTYEELLGKYKEEYKKITERFVIPNV